MIPSQEASLETLFYSESKKRLASIRKSLSDYKRGQGGLDKILATLHTLKGSSNMMGLKELAQRLHALEEEFGKVDSPESESLPVAEVLLEEVAQQLQNERSNEDSATPEVIIQENALTVFQHLLGSVSRLERLSTGSASTDQQDISMEVVRLRELAFRSIFAPARNLFSGLNELSQVVGKSERKPVKLVCRSNTDQILRDYLTELRGALVHLVSNCIVHGLEPPARRREIGKSAEGIITIDVFQEDQNLCLEVRDDGSGVNLEALRDKFEAEDGSRSWDSLGLRAQMNLLFEQGRSLREGADLHSGRGVGLAAVKESVERLRGRVSFTPSEVGTCLRIEVPSPFFLTRCLLVRDQGHLFGALAASVSRVSEMDGEQRFASLSESFGYSSRESGANGVERYALHPISTQGQEIEPIGYTVSECLGLQELLVYALPRVDGLSLSAVGMAESIDEQLFVVDLEELSPARFQRRKPAEDIPQTVKKRLLVVDDSPTTRSILTEVLRRAGYHVEEATDGNEGRIALETRSFDLVVSDLEMPDCNGLQLLEWIRSEESPVSNIPFVLFTSRDDIKSFETAHLLGADRCLGKSQFQEGVFLRLLEQLL